MINLQGGLPGHLIGAHIAVKVITGDVFTGVVFCYDLNATNTLILREVKLNGKQDFFVIKVNTITEIQALSPSNSASIGEGTLPTCSPAVLEVREQKALDAFEKKRHTIGVGVTEEAQQIFDFVQQRNPDCRWIDGNLISVMDVRILPPYYPENVALREGGNPNAAVWIKRVLEGFHERAGHLSNVDRPGVPAPAGLSTQEDMESAMGVDFYYGEAPTSASTAVVISHSGGDHQPHNDHQGSTNSPPSDSNEARAQNTSATLSNELPSSALQAASVAQGGPPKAAQTGNGAGGSASSMAAEEEASLAAAVATAAAVAGSNQSISFALSSGSQGGANSSPGHSPLTVANAIAGQHNLNATKANQQGHQGQGQGRPRVGGRRSRGAKRKDA